MPAGGKAMAPALELDHQQRFVFLGLDGPEPASAQPEPDSVAVTPHTVHAVDGDGSVGRAISHSGASRRPVRRLRSRLVAFVARAAITCLEPTQTYALFMCRLATGDEHPGNHGRTDSGDCGLGAKTAHAAPQVPLAGLPDSEAQNFVTHCR